MSLVIRIFSKTLYLNAIIVFIKIINSDYINSDLFPHLNSKIQNKWDGCTRLSSEQHDSEEPTTFPNEPPFQPLATGGVKQTLTFAECLQLQGSAVGTVVDGRRRGGGGGLRGRGGSGGERSRWGGRGERGGGQGWGRGRRGEGPDEEDICGARLEVVDTDPCGSRLHSRIALILLFLPRQNAKL